MTQQRGHSSVPDADSPAPASGEEHPVPGKQHSGFELASSSRQRPLAGALVAPHGQVATDVRAAAGGRPGSEPPPGAEPLWGGRLRIIDEVGRGAMGSVLRGMDMKLQRELALKVAPLPRDQMQRPMLARFVEEAQITAQLEHPNVVPVHDLGLDPDGRAYFSMKLVRGQSLEDIIEKRQAGDPQTLAEFGLRRLLDVFLQVCQGLEYAHARGVIHRDLKPANIMVGDFGEVLLMDWGIAKLKGQPERAADELTPSNPGAEPSMPPPRPSSLFPSAQVTSVRSGKKAWATQHGALIGTPAYMSPEQARGVSDERSDLYSLGVILYEILCGQVPFDDEEPKRIVERLLKEPPQPPSQINKNVPAALETLALRLLEKDPERRNITIQQIRAHVQNYIEGVGRDYRPEALWSTVLFSAGALLLFAFLVWYLTGQSVATVLALGPPAVLNAAGWFLVMVALSYPLWASYTAFRASRTHIDLFQPPNRQQIFVSGYLAHRTFATSIAPLFQLVFLLELCVFAIWGLSQGTLQSAELVGAISKQMRAEWAQALVIVSVFLFAYQFLLSTEVRFARRVERYEPLVDRRRWESAWPYFLIVVLLLTIGTTDVLDDLLTGKRATLGEFLRHQITQSINLFDVAKTLVFQGTFLLGLTGATLLISFPFAEILSALRIPYQPADEAAVSSRFQYFVRSLAVFRVAWTNWLYGGAIIGSLTAITILSEGANRPLVEKVLYILGPSLIGFLGYWSGRRYVRGYLANAPAVQRMLTQELERARRERLRATLEQLEAAPWRWRFVELAVPVACVLLYLVWTGSGIHQQAIAKLILPVTTKGWLLILPYAMLVIVLLARDPVQRRTLRKKLAS